MLDPAQTRVVCRKRGLVQRVEDAIGDQPQDDSELSLITALGGTYQVLVDVAHRRDAPAWVFGPSDGL